MKKILIITLAFFIVNFVNAQINYSDIVVCKNVNGAEQRAQLKATTMADLIDRFGQPTAKEVRAHDREGGDFNIYKFGKTKFLSGYEVNCFQILNSFEINTPEFYIYLSNIGIYVRLGLPLSSLASYFPTQYAEAQIDDLGVKSFGVVIGNTDNVLVFSADVTTGNIVSIEIYEPL